MYFLYVFILQLVMMHGTYNVKKVVAYLEKLKQNLLGRAKKSNKTHQSANLTLCVPCIILQCVNDQRDAQFL